MGHSAQIEWIEKGLKIDVRGTVRSWSDFMEVAELRNLFTHTDGVVSQQFLTEAKKHGIKVSSGIALGEQLRMSADYFGRAYKTTLRQGLGVGYLCRHRIADDSKIAASLRGSADGGETNGGRQGSSGRGCQAGGIEITAPA
jgi:hypothetical protein